jgi:plasmid maintenance system antidote protein VapI|nr:MAG TPA: LAMBDA REPRESSOR (TRIPLE MUTANT)/DNA COMPLEX-DNA COMPLEX, DOUBLE HELIX, TRANSCRIPTION-DNA.1A [Caudoviricetes sp.]
MVKNNIEVDVKVKLLEAEKTQQQLGEEIGTTGQYINRILKKNGGIVNDTFVKMMDALGYNIVLTYEKKD